MFLKRLRSKFYADFESYRSSEIDTQPTLLLKFMKVLDYLKNNPKIGLYEAKIAYTQVQFSADSLNLYGNEVKLGDCIIFTDGKLAFVSSIGENIVGVGSAIDLRGEQGERGETGATGQNGRDGTNGTNGTSITDVEIVPTSSTDEGVTYQMTVTLDNERQINAGDFIAHTGKQGERGERGETGATGQDGKNGTSIERVEVKLEAEEDTGNNYVMNVFLSDGSEQEAGTFFAKKGISDVYVTQTRIAVTPTVGGGVLYFYDTGNFDSIEEIINFLSGTNSNNYMPASGYLQIDGNLHFIVGMYIDVDENINVINWYVTNDKIVSSTTTVSLTTTSSRLI